MIALAFIACIDLVLLHGPIGQRVFVNPCKVISLREPRGNDLQHFSHGTHCIIVTVDGKFIPIRENCDDVRDALHAQ